MVQRGVKKKLIIGIYSGFFYVDPQGTANESSFTITVSDSEPHFFYMIKEAYLTHCSTLGVWSTYFKYDPEWDVIFALNPVIGLLEPL